MLIYVNVTAGLFGQEDDFQTVRGLLERGEDDATFKVNFR